MIYMKKNLLIMLVAVLGIVACGDVESIEKKGSQNSDIKSTSSDLAEFEESIYVDYYNFFVAGSLGSLDFSKAYTFNFDGKEYYSIPSVSSITTGNQNTPSLPKSYLIGSKIREGVWYTHVVDLSNSQFADGELLGGVGLSLVNGIEFGYIDTQGKLLDGAGTGQLPNIAMVNPWEKWWSCTTTCYKEAKDACQGDPECNFICDLLDLAGGCTVSIAAGCAGHCANQGIAPPPTKDPLLASTTNDPYCFD